MSRFVRHFLLPGLAFTLLLYLTACTAPSQLDRLATTDLEPVMGGVEVIAEVGAAAARVASPTRPLAAGVATEAAGTIAIYPSRSPVGYLPLALYGIPPQSPPADADEGGLVLGLAVPFRYCNRDYDTLLWSVNGTVEPGAASGSAAPGANTALPAPTPPNTLLAPWWTDLDLGSGSWYLAHLAGAGSQYLVLEWTDVARRGDPTARFTFQTWIELGSSNIWFVYGPASGDLVAGTVGAEDPRGGAGATRYLDGSGALPWGGPDLMIDSSACFTDANTPPIADTGGPYRVIAGLDLVLDGRASLDPDGDPLSYAWDLDGDGSDDAFTATAAMTTDPKDDGSVHEVTLRVSDPAGASASASTLVTVVSQVGSLEELIAAVERSVPVSLTAGQANGLVRPLRNAIRSLTRDKTRPACSQIGDFIGGLERLTPTPLAVAEATGFTVSAELIRAAIGCD